MNKLAGLWIQNPAPFLVRLAAADIRVGQLEDVLTVGKLLVIGGRHAIQGGHRVRGEPWVNFKFMTKSVRFISKDWSNEEACQAVYA